MFFVYLIQNENNNDDFYVGFSANLEKRLLDHNSGRNLSTRGRKWKLIYYEAYHVEQAARNRERKLKHDGRVRQFLMKRIKEYL